MKRILKSVPWIIALIISIHAFPQAGVEKKVVATLGPGETLVYGENCFILDQEPGALSFVTVTGSGTSKQYYCYGPDGSRTGPFKSPDARFWAACADRKEADCVPNDEPNMANLEKYYDYSDQSLNFKGKKFSGIGQLLLINISKDEQHFYAVSVDMEMKIRYFDDSGRKVELLGMPDQIILSPDGKNAYARVNGSLNPFDPEYYNKIMANPEYLNDPEVFLVGMDGTKSGPYSSSSFTDAWFTDSGQFVVYANSEISLNGKTLFKTDGHISPCDLWISSNGSAYAWANYDRITFNDGTAFNSPLEVKYTPAGGKGYLKWISLEEGKNLVLYKKAL